MQRSTATRTLGAVLLTGAAGLGYSAGIEVRNFALRRVEIPCLPEGNRPLRVLHVSDLHMTPGQVRKQRWLRSLAGLAPDLVVNTGDNLSHMRSVPVVLDAFGPLLDVPGVFVFGSNDYYAPKPRNPLLYLTPDTGRRNTNTPALPVEDLRAGFTGHGWVDLTNTTGLLEVGGSTLAFAGVDDPHLGLDDLSAVAGQAPSDADVRIAVAHAPYLRVLDQFAEDGYDLTFAGHTHGGQLCLPFKGALVTNCDLETARAKGLHRHPAASRPGDPRSSWLHVSAGAGTSPYAPVRFCCRPEATLVTLTPVRAAVLAPAA
jgi:predicted MPP superfamily phosphohydrolase